MQDVINGTDLRLYLGGKPIGAATSCTMSLSRETRETVHKDNPAGWATSKGAKRSYSISFEGFKSDLIDRNGVSVVSFKGLFEMFNGEEISWMMSTGEVGTEEYCGTAILTELSATGPVEENSTASGSLTGTGELLSSTITA